jgi:hypothetical protein
VQPWTKTEFNETFKPIYNKFLPQEPESRQKDLEFIWYISPWVVSWWSSEIGELLETTEQKFEYPIHAQIVYCGKEDSICIGVVGAVYKIPIENISNIAESLENKIQRPFPSTYDKEFTKADKYVRSWLTENYPNLKLTTFTKTKEPYVRILIIVPPTEYNESFSNNLTLQLQIILSNFGLFIDQYSSKYIVGNRIIDFPDVNLLTRYI